MGRGEEQRLILAAGQVDAAVDHAPEECGVAGGVASRRGQPAGHGKRLGAGLEEDRQHAADAGDRGGDTGLKRRPAEPSLEPATEPFELGIGRPLPQFLERRRARRHGERIARQRARLKHLADREDVVHHIGPAAVGPQRQSAPHDLAQRGQVGLDAEQFLRAAECEPEARHHLVAHKQPTVAAGQPADRVEKLPGRPHEAHVAHHRLHEHGRDFAATLPEEILELLRLVVLQHDGVFGGARRHPGRVRHAERRGC